MTRRPWSSAQRASRLATGTACLLSTLVIAAAPVAAQEAVTIGDRYDDGLDSRLSAQHLAGAARAVGYPSQAHTTGRSADDAWSDALGASVYGLFGHANAGLFQTDEGPTDPQDEFIAAGELTTLSTSVGNLWWWKDYLPFIDVEFVKFAVLAGCYTANTDPTTRSFLTMGRDLGIDSLVGFSDLVYYPASCTSCNYSGNLFWDRFADYAQAGNTVSVALAKARADLVSLEGNAGGWDTYRIGGGVANPGAVTLTPAGYGEGYNSKPYGIDPFDPLALSTAQRQAITVGNQQLTDVVTEEGVHYRLAEDDSLAFVWAPASQQGDIRLSEEQAQEAARAFVRRHVPWFDQLGLALVDQRPIGHVEGELLQQLTWRTTTDGGGPGPAMVTVEIDRRTGAVTYLSAARRAPNTTRFAVDRERALVAARAEAGEGDVVSVQREVWDRPRWIVTFAAGPADHARVTIDGQTGEVLSVVKT